jgi:hypothetical protein
VLFSAGGRGDDACLPCAALDAWAAYLLEIVEGKDLLPKLAKAKSCRLTANIFTDRCRLRYGEERRIRMLPEKDQQ